MPQTTTHLEPVQAEIVAADAFQKTTHEVDVITCEYPPKVGGVADYTFQVVAQLKNRNCEARVWTRGNESVDADLPAREVERSFHDFGLRDILSHDRPMGTAKDRSLLLQWEPVGFGLQSVNLPFCLWIATRVLRGTRLLVMFHETFLPFNKRSLKRYLAGAVQRLMAFVLLNAASAVFASNESGARSLKRLCFRPAKVAHLPVFSNIESGRESVDRVVALRKELVRTEELLIGHFGRYMANTAPLVLPVLKALLEGNPKAKVLFIGECGPKYSSVLLAGNPELKDRILSSGVRTSEEIGTFIRACDLMFQPYPGGVTTKRSSTMAALAHGRCVVSNRGPETERLWGDCFGLRLLDSVDPAEVAAELSRLARAQTELAERSAAAEWYYQKHFSLNHTIDALMAALGSPEPALEKTAQWR